VRCHRSKFLILPTSAFSFQILSPLTPCSHPSTGHRQLYCQWKVKQIIQIVEAQPTPATSINGRQEALAPAANKNCKKYFEPAASAVLSGITSTISLTTNSIIPVQYVFTLGNTINCEKALTNIEITGTGIPPLAFATHQP